MISLGEQPHESWNCHNGGRPHTGPCAANMRFARPVEPGTARRLVTARKSYWCFEDWAHDRHIKPGDRYVRYTIFKNHDFIGSIDGRPYVLRLCLGCADALGVLS